MSADILALIDENMEHFSKGQKRIARYMTEYYNKAAYMTAARLGKEVGVSESTVVRFATELGFEGYPQLQKSLQALIRNKLTALQRMEATDEQMEPADVLQKVLLSDVDKIKKTLEETSREEFRQVVELLVQAKRVYIIGIRSAYALASFLYFYSNLILDDVKLVQTNTASEMFEQVLKIDEQDVLLALSFPRYSQRTIKAARYAKQQGATVVAVTDSSASPLCAVADHSLLAQSDMASFVDSLVAPMSLLNALIAAVGMRKKEEVAGTFAKLESIWEEFSVYEKESDHGAL